MRPGLSLTGIRLGHVPTAGVSRVACSPYACMPSPLPRRDSEV